MDRKDDIMKMKKKKQWQKEIFSLIFDMNELEKRCRMANDVRLETMELEDFEYYIRRYLELYAEGKAKVSKLNDSKFRKNAEKELRNSSKKMKDLLTDNLYRIFYPLGNTSIRAIISADLESKVKEVEDEFEKNVLEASEYFGGQFMDYRLRSSSSAMDQFNPKTIRDMLSDQKRYDWTEHIINIGYPVPKYLNLYRESLLDIIKNYINMKEKEALVEKN